MEEECDIMDNRDANNDNNGYESIWIGWKKWSWTFQLLLAHKQCIHGRLTNVGGNMFKNEWLKNTQSYGNNTTYIIRTISDSHDWLTTTNFNEILPPTKHDRFSQFDHVGASEFNNAIQGLMELKAVGGEPIPSTTFMELSTQEPNSTMP